LVEEQIAETTKSECGLQVISCRARKLDTFGEQLRRLSGVAKLAFELAQVVQNRITEVIDPVLLGSGERELETVAGLRRPTCKSRDCSQYPQRFPLAGGVLELPIEGDTSLTQLVRLYEFTDQGLEESGVAIRLRSRRFTDRVCPLEGAVVPVRNLTNGKRA
jgi:hypothetical protein